MEYFVQYVICTFVIPQEPRICSQGVFCQQFLGYVTFHGGTARSVFESLTKAMLALLAERVWCSKSQSSLTTEYSLPSQWVPVLPPIHTTPKCETELFRYVTLHFQGRRGAASIGPLQKSRRNHRFYTVFMCAASSPGTYKKPTFILIVHGSYSWMEFTTKNKRKM